MSPTDTPQPLTAAQFTARRQAASLGMSTTPEEPLSAQVYILTLISLFPALHRARGQEFDIDTFLKPLPRLSPGERQITLFVATVWNSDDAKARGLTFDLADAAHYIDPQARRVIATWLANPFFP